MKTIKIEVSKHNYSKNVSSVLVKIGNLALGIKKLLRICSPSTRHKGFKIASNRLAISPLDVKKMLEVDQQYEQ